MLLILPIRLTICRSFSIRLRRKFVMNKFVPFGISMSCSLASMIGLPNKLNPSVEIGMLLGVSGGIRLLDAGEV